MQKRKVAIIPARGGSKRIERKNLKLFHGMPIMAYSIRLAHSCGLFDEVVVSSDDSEILEVARQYGASTPFVRPQALSTDEAATLPVIKHAVENLGLNDEDMVCCIYPTAPLLEEKYLKEGLEALSAQAGKDYAFSVVEFESSPFRGFAIQDEVLTLLFPKYQLFRSQDLQKIYHDAGAFYWGYARSFVEERAIFGSDSIPVVLPRMLAQDIDTMDDWHLAEIKYKMKHSSE